MISKRLGCLLVCYFALSFFVSTAAAQRFSAILQFSSPANFSSLVALSQFEFAIDPVLGLTTGIRVSLQTTANSGFIFRLNPFALYRLPIISSEQWFLIGYGGVNTNLTYAPNLVANTGLASNNYVALTGANQRKNGSEDEDDNSGPRPDPDPATVLEVRLTGLAGLDGAYFLSEQMSLYFGFEFDTDILPNLQWLLFPYFELGFSPLAGLTLALGGYLGVGSGFLYNIYVAAFYELTNNSALKLELSFTGTLGASLRFSLRG